MPLETQGANDLLTNGLTAFTHVGALTALTPTEVAGGSYARQAVTWTAAASRNRDNNALLAIPIPAATTVVAAGIWSAVSAGNLEAIVPIGSSIVQGGASIPAATDLFTSMGHGLTTDDRVFFRGLTGEALPAGLSLTVLYFVLASGLTTDAFKVSTTSGGGALDVTANGDVRFWKTVPETFTNAGTLSIATGALDFPAYD